MTENEYAEPKEPRMMSDTRDVLTRAQAALDSRYRTVGPPGTVSLISELVDALIQARAEVAALLAKPMERLK